MENDVSDATDAPCNQYGKPAVTKMGKSPLCVDCYTKIVGVQVAAQNAHTAAQNAQNDFLAYNLAMQNHLIEEMESAVGLRGFSPRIQIPQRTQHTTINNTNTISVAHSVIGAINAGYARDIQAGVSRLKAAGHEEAAAALKALADTVVAEKALSAQQQRDLLEHVAFLSAQAAVPMQERKPCMIKSAIKAVTEGAQAVTSVAAAWKVVSRDLILFLGS